MVDNHADPMNSVQAALNAPEGSQEQIERLQALREALETNAGTIPTLCIILLSKIVSSPDAFLKTWTIDLLQFGLSKANLSVEARSQFALQSLDVAGRILADDSPLTLKQIIGCFASIYPLIFRCTNRSLSRQWEVLTQCKRRVLSILFADGTPVGVQVAAVKFLQRVILVQTRGHSDPRLQSKTDPHLSLCPADHPFISAAELENEGNELMQSVITLFYNKTSPDVLTAILNSWATFVKNRPAHLHTVITVLSNWTPDSLRGLPYFSIRSVEKAIRLLLVHISKGPHGSTYGPRVNETLRMQAQRMERGLEEERARRAMDDTRKRAAASDAHGGDAKRLKLDNNGVTQRLRNFDFTNMQPGILTELVMAALNSVTEARLQATVDAYRAANSIDGPPQTNISSPITSSSSQVPPEALKAEPVDPLQMDIDDGDLEFEPEKLNQKLSQRESGEDVADVEETNAPLELVDFQLPAPRSLNEESREAAAIGSMTRMWGGIVPVPDVEESTSKSQRSPNVISEMIILLIVRLVTRRVPPPDDYLPDESTREDSDDKMDVVVHHEDNLRKGLLDYVRKDFSSRARLATAWMNDEWYNDHVLSKTRTWTPNYDIWLRQILDSQKDSLDPKDRSFSRFLLDLPLIPPEVLARLRDLCVDQERMPIGFTTLREMVSLRPPVREKALRILLELTTHPERVMRNAAIITVKRWVPDTQPMSDSICAYASSLLKRLCSSEHDVDMDKTSPQTASEQDLSKYLEDLTVPVSKSVVVQHLELPLALSVKIPEFLDELFDAYGDMHSSIQEAIHDHITPLVRSLGQSSPKLLELLASFKPGAESLALRILTILTEHTRPNVALVNAMKSLITDRNMSPRFVIPVMAEMDKADITRYLPRIVAMLDTTQEMKSIVRSVFGAVIEEPVDGSVSTNLPRMRQSELLTPVELMVLLHDSEKEIGLKSAIEAIGLCFQMTDIFKSDTWAVVMQHIVEQPVLPVLFLRTVIQAVTTYKSLVAWVSTTLLSRLITKKIWTIPPLWEGFIRCAAKIAPASFGSLLQLPKDQLKELVSRQPGLKAGLRDHVLKNRSGNKAKVAGFLEIFRDESDTDGGRDETMSPTPAPLASAAA